MELFGQMSVNALVLAALYVMLATGLTLVYGIMHQVNFAHGEVMMLGGMLAFLLIDTAGINYFVAILIVMIAAAIFGVVFDKLIWKPAAGNWITGYMASLGVSIAIVGISWIMFGSLAKNVEFPWRGNIITFLGTNISVERIFSIIVGIIVIVGLFYLVQRTKVGREMRAVEQDREAALLMGINVNNISTLAMVLGCVMAALSGVLFGGIFYLTPAVGFAPMLKAFTIIIIGGVGSIPGVVLGGLILGAIDSFGGTLLGHEIAYGLSWLVLIIIIVIRPWGLLGQKR